ncbi:MAG: hypothetical protein QXK37_02565 [Candidatus Woesearchaeota archaeon]
MNEDFYSQEMPETDKGGFSLFKKNNASENAQFSDLISQIKDASRRLRVIEERYASLRKNIQVNEQNMLAESKKFQAEIKAINSDITEIKRILLEMKEEMRMIVLEVKESVKKEELKILERYINLWEPVHFVTIQEIDKYVRSSIENIEKERSIEKEKRL